MSAVAVTGLGAIGPWGAGRVALAEALAAGRKAALVPEVDLSRWVTPAESRRASRPSRWAVAAARMALEDAGIPSLEGRRTSVVFATAFGSVQFTEKLVRQIFEEGPQAAQPFYFSECVANAPAAQIALAVGARGSNVTIAGREAGALAALARGAAEIDEGRADCAIVGAGDEMTPLLHALLDRFGALARPGKGGVLAAEGVSVVVLEREADAKARRVAPCARLRAAFSAFDPSATESDWGTGHEVLAAALVRGLARSGLSVDDVDRIVSGASGATRADALEERTLRAAWGERPLPPVVTPKAVVGEYGGGHLAATVLAASEAAIPSRLLGTALAAGGSAAWAVLERA